MAISSNIVSKLSFELNVIDWKVSGLLKPSIFKSAIATIEKRNVLTKLGSLTLPDVENLEKMVREIC